MNRSFSIMVKARATAKDSVKRNACFSLLKMKNTKQRRKKSKNTKLDKLSVKQFIIIIRRKESFCPPIFLSL